MHKLLIIPCCARKRPGGEKVGVHAVQLEDVVSSEVYADVLSGRADVLSAVRSKPRYLSGKHSKNASIQDGPEFGGDRLNGQYMPAIERYIGSLYSGTLEFAEAIRNNEHDNSKISVLILSALYGPLHPLDMIQDYNLQMSDSPAYQVWKHQFPLFIEEYVERKQIGDVHLYVGSSTRYYRVAEMAIARLKRRDLIKSAVQYDVIGGSSYITPHTHGRLMYSHLVGESDSQLESSVIARQL